MWLNDTWRVLAVNRLVKHYRLPRYSTRGPLRHRKAKIPREDVFLNRRERMAHEIAVAIQPERWRDEHGTRSSA
jgi:hypothetical protein